MTISALHSPTVADIFLLAKKHSSPVIFPTDTIYGIGALLSDIKAQEKIFTIKKRNINSPFPILVADIEMVKTIADIDHISESCKKMIYPSWQEKTTFILYAKNNLNDIYKKNDKVAIRVSSSKQLSDIIRTLGEPLTATSVNISGDIERNSFKDIFKNYMDVVDFYIYGNSISEQSSTIIDLTSNEPFYIR